MKLTHSFWIGATDEEPGKGWQWTDFSPFNYFNWADGMFVYIQLVYIYKIYNGKGITLVYLTS